MISSELRQGGSYRFEVLKNLSTRKYYKVRTDDNIEFSLLKFKFQHNLPVPDYIDCYVKCLSPSIVLGQDISIFIRNLYSEGRDYSFIVKAIKQDPDIRYELEDENGLCFKLFNAPQSLTKGSRVKCKITKIRGAKVSLKYVGTLSLRLPLEFYDIYQWLNFLNINKHQDYYLKLLESVPEFHNSLLKYDEEEPSWILEILQVCSIHITDWLIACKDNLRDLSRVCSRMTKARDLALFILEESDYLRACNPEQRTMLQSRLSNYVELFNQFGQAASKILKKTHVKFIDKMFSRLKEAGYLYHPSKQFRIMMTILKLRPELINSRMGELFEALHNWDLSNWQSDPFRPALVEQLQIFIEGNYRQMNILPANDTSEDNKALIRMILAIAVQRLLSTETDNINYNLNRAMLYRYISYLIPGEVDTLLNKGIEAILGIETPNEFTWSDTDHPTLLFLKSSHPSPENEDRDIVVKSYSTSKADIQLRSSGLKIIARDADPSQTAIPNNLIDWLNPSIAICDIPTIYNTRKTKDIGTYRKMWDMIDWSIFGIEQTAGERIEKSIPDAGDEVKVIIDDIRIDRNANERQRIQFHCTIHDELFHGEGWMPCDALHMFGWLKEKDIPVNYDGSLRFAQNEDGMPLLFNATVYRKNGELEFSMKSQIEDFLLENTWQGQESIAIVTFLDKGNNVWLCLSERGSTFKVACDESTSHLNIGKLVRVSYIEPDRSNTTSQFFIGELAKNQEDIPLSIRKSQSLFNLMQSIGENPDESEYDNFEVTEVEEMMSREELLELIYILQRRANAEIEYIKAFNYLGLAYILCKLAEEQNLLKEISSHMNLLELLQDFGRNQSIDMAELEKYEDMVRNIPMLERLHTRLKIVADIDTNENSDWLWAMRQKPRNETEKQLAALVLSYNMLPKELEKSRKEIMREITTLLNVNSAAPTSKYYGDESQTVEFKSSLIYSTHGGTRADAREQLHEIMHIICGFMNARGGTLYIGVNDSGYENGLDDDLTYRKAHGYKPSIDSMIVDLQNNLDRTMPSHAKDHWEISSDPEAKKGVIIVKVLPVETPVELEGIIYVRSSSTTKPRLDEERTEFIKNRPHNFQLLMKLWGVGEQEKTDISGKQKPTNDTKSGSIGKPLKHRSIVQNNSSIKDDLKDVSLSENYSRILTGHHRCNALHEYESNYANPSFYIYFMDNNEFEISATDKYLETDDKCRLVLAIREKEMDSFLILSYSDGHIVKLPIAIIANLSQDERYAHRSGMILEYANIASQNDCLLSVIKAHFGNIFYRIDHIANIPESEELISSGKPMCDNLHKIMAQEIITPDKLSFFSPDSIDKEKRFFGFPIPQGDGTLTEDERISKLLKPVAHSE